jgi:hypothetical protein
MAPHKFKSATNKAMNNYKATPKQWEEVGAFVSATRDCILELRSRVEALEAQANHSPGATKMVPVAKVTRDRDETGNYVIVHDTATPPPVATDEELDDTWHKTTEGTFLARRRALYDLGIEYGQASSREVAEPAPVAGGLVGELVADLRAMATHAGLACQPGDFKILTRAADLLEQEAGR